MVHLGISLNGDGSWPDLAGKDVAQGKIDSVAVLEGGMTSGEPSVAFRIEMDDGSTVVAETSWRMLHLAARAIEARYGAPE